MQEELDRLIALEASASFDLEDGPLIRGRLIRLAEEEQVLLITMHHIVSDGWSMGVFIQELSDAIQGLPADGRGSTLSELEIQYADYAVWQRQWFDGGILQQQAAYWKAALAELLRFWSCRPIMRVRRSRTMRAHLRGWFWMSN